jgi:hypothetical protein
MASKEIKKKIKYIVSPGIVGDGFSAELQYSIQFIVIVRALDRAHKLKPSPKMPRKFIVVKIQHLKYF